MHNLAKIQKSFEKPKTQHLVVEIFEITQKNLIDGDNLCRILQNFCQNMNLNIVSFLKHQFEPFGFSVVFILQESHLAAHSWPELGCLHLDILTCGNDLEFDKIQLFWTQNLPNCSIKITKLNY